MGNIPGWKWRPRLAAVVLALVLALGLCSTTTAQGASNGWLKKTVRIGVLQEPKSLNPWLASDAWSWKVLRLIYQVPYIREPGDLKLVPWMAAGMPVYDPDKITYTLKLRPAKWSDGSEFTSEDVVFTVNLVKKFKLPRYSSLWGFVKKAEALDGHTVRFFLKTPKAVFVTRTLATPIVQKKQWSKIAALAKKSKKPLAALLRYKLEKPQGTGPFMVAGWRPGAYIYLKRNPHFFGQGLTIAGHKLGPHVDGIIFKVYGTSDAAILALRKGDIDVYLNGIEPGYLDELAGQPGITTYHSKRSALYYFGFNLRRPPFNDRALRLALAALIDKALLVKRVLQGGAEPMYSLVPPGNVRYYNPDVNTHGKGLDRAGRIKRAYKILKDAGYTWEQPPVDAGGKLQVPARGLKDPGGKPVKPFTILTPPADYDPNRAMAGMLIQEWAKDLGLPAEWRPSAFNALLRSVKYEHKFDAFVLGYGRLNPDPGYLRLFFHGKQDRRRGRNMAGYHNPDFDRISIKSDGEMDPEARRELILGMQRMLMEDIPYFPLYNPVLVEGVRNDRFTGWVPMLEGIGNLWSYCEIRPVGK